MRAAQRLPGGFSLAVLPGANDGGQAKPDELFEKTVAFADAAGHPWVTALGQGCPAVGYLKLYDGGLVPFYSSDEPDNSDFRPRLVVALD